MKITEVYGECNESDVSVCSSVVIYEDKGSEHSLEIRYPASCQKEVASRFSLPINNIVHIISLACIIKYPEYKHRTSIFLNKEEILLVFEELNLDLIQKLYRNINETGWVELDSTLVYFQ
ncbi:hypothetical protein [Halobacillus sp. Marseille-P3879]|uniref:hypothetical protein n=1 Tax=Halobacillus TaxID=45667 RepID=UPI000C7E200D|nr:hypothetical protein [Halobacillus sp. Marseille-P3879]